MRHTLLDDVLTTLTTDMPTASKTSSRDLAGILKNLRKVEQAVQGGNRELLRLIHFRLPRPSVLASHIVTRSMSHQITYTPLF